MEDKIEVGEYIKDKEGNITKICNILNLDRDMYLYVGEDGFQYSDNAIVRHSKQLIDLMEVGDFVNGHKVKAIYLNGATKYIKLDNAYKDGQGTRTYEENIETILTKELYEANCYKTVKE